uniref:Isoleucine--tRNA ligase, cytoplasmic-like n=1 Tax=Ciona intestinalis TaxID=7719 RepID=H2XMI5_CIOIN
KGCNGNTGVVLLENPVQSNPISLHQLKEQTKVLFGQRGKSLKLFAGPDLSTELESMEELLRQKIVFAAV